MHEVVWWSNTVDCMVMLARRSVEDNHLAV